MSLHRPAVRYALKVAYDGTRFHGNQVQPDVRTVHGELASALADLKQPTERVLWASRTDAGVSAAGNVAVVESELPPESLVPGLTFRMKDAWVWAAAPVDDRFEPRHARARRYRYHMTASVDAAALQSALNAFVGYHNFRAFCRLEEGVDPYRIVRSISTQRQGAVLLIDIVGPSFLWNQVRRMVEAGRRIAAGDLHDTAIRAALVRGEPDDFGCAPPEPLVLLDVEYDKLAFAPPPDDVRGRIAARLGDRLADAARAHAVWESIAQAARAT